MLWVHVVGSVVLLGNFFVFSQKWRSSIEKKDVKSGYNKPPDMKYKNLLIILLYFWLHTDNQILKIGHF
jgi:hypothetical protein